MRYLKYIMAILCIMSIASAQAQTGLLGKKFIIKSNPLLPIIDGGFDVEVEAAIFRKASLSLHYLRSKQEMSWGESNANAFVTGHNIGIRYKVYLLTSTLAPKGAYIEFYVYGGNMEASGFDADNSSDPFNWKSNVYMFGNSIGKQFIVSRRIAVDCYVGYGSMGLIGSGGDVIKNQVGQLYAPHIEFVNFWANNEVTELGTSSSLYAFAGVSIGVLLF